MKYSAFRSRSRTGFRLASPQMVRVIPHRLACLIAPNVPAPYRCRTPVRVLNIVLRNRGPAQYPRLLTSYMGNAMAIS